MDYDYTLLPADQDTIRLVDIRPTSDSRQPIQCSMRPVQLSSKPEYAALSYVWGGTTFDHEIAVNGASFPITTSLHLALVAFRKSGRVTIWVDQICIDQTNVAERTQQVRLMTSIYQQCDYVFISLLGGLAEGNDDFYLIQLFNEINIRFGEGMERGWVPPLSELVNEEQRHGWGAFSRLMEHPWFSRAWVVQEAAVCPKAIIALGDFDYDFTALIGFWNPYIQAHQNRIVSNSPDNLRAQRVARTFLETLRVYGRVGNAIPLIELVCNLKLQQSTDPRDKIFAVLGLAEDVGDYFQPDYSKSVEQVYIDFATCFLNQIPRANVPPGRLLLQAGRHNQRLSLPSWVPDWDALMREGDLFTFHGHLRINQFRETVIPLWGDAKPQPIRIDSASVVPELHIRGQIRDIIVASTPPIPPPRPRGEEGDFPAFQILVNNLFLKHGELKGQSLGEILRTVPKYEALQPDQPPYLAYLEDVDEDWVIVLDFSWFAQRFANTLAADAFRNIRPDEEGEESFKGRAYEALLAMHAYFEEDYMPSRDDLLTTTYLGTVDSIRRNRSFCITFTGNMGLVPVGAEPGDRIAILEGVGGVVGLRRSTEVEGAWVLIGDAFIEGLSRLIDQEHAVECGVLEFEELVLV